MPRQEVAFREEYRKIKGFGSLREDFYTRFKPKNKDLGLWHGGGFEGLKMTGQGWMENL